MTEIFQTGANQGLKRNLQLWSACTWSLIRKGKTEELPMVTTTDKKSWLSSGCHNMQNYNQTLSLLNSGRNQDISLVGGFCCCSYIFFHFIFFIGEYSHATQVPNTKWPDPGLILAVQVGMEVPYHWSIRGLACCCYLENHIFQVISNVSGIKYARLIEQENKI